MRVGRRPAIVVFVALLVAGGLADRASRPAPLRARPPGTELMPTAAPATALSSTWYCAGATATPGSAAAGTVVVANAGARAVRGSVTVVPSQGPARTRPVEVGPRSATAVGLAEVAPAPFAAALVDLDGGQVVVELAVAGAEDEDVTPCASAASDHWYLPDASTAKDASLVLSLFNPFPEDAIADLSFSTDQGRAAPADFQGIVVPGRSLVVEQIGEHVRRREAVATEVVARSGRLVVAQTQVRSAPGRAGSSVALGAPSPGRLWYFPDGLIGDGLVERYALVNPSAREAKVLVDVRLERGDAEPFELGIAPHGRLALVLNEESRIPKGVAHSTTVRSLNGVPVVAARTIEAAAPAPRSGRADTLGARRAATRWAFAAGGATEAVDEWLVLQSVGRPATVSVAGLAAGQALAVEGLQRLTVPAGGRLALRVGEHVKRASLPLVVESDVPIVAERALYRAGRPGLSSTIGIPLG